MAREDLIPFNERTEDERKKIAQKGGLASGAARRRKRSLKEAADMYLALAPADKKIKSKMVSAGVDEDDADNQMAMIVGLVGRAIKGDAKAAKVIIDLLGEDAPEQTSVDDGFLDALKGEAEEVWQE